MDIFWLVEREGLLFRHGADVSFGIDLRWSAKPLAGFIWERIELVDCAFEWFQQKCSLPGTRVAYNFLQEFRAKGILLCHKPAGSPSTPATCFPSLWAEGRARGCFR